MAVLRYAVAVLDDLELGEDGIKLRPHNGLLRPARIHQLQPARQSSVISFKSFMGDLTAADRAMLMGMLPKEDLASPEQLCFLFSSNAHFRSSLAVFQDLLRRGFYDPTVQNRMRAKRRRKEGWTEFKEKEYEEYCWVNGAESAEKVNDLREKLVEANRKRKQEGVEGGMSRRMIKKEARRNRRDQAKANRSAVK